MKHCLSAVGVSVDYDAISVVGDALLTRDLGRSQEQMAQGFPVIFICLIQRIKMFAWHDQNMDRGLGAYVIKSYAGVVFIDALGRNITRSNPAKQTIRTHIAK